MQSQHHLHCYSSSESRPHRIEQEWSDRGQYSNDCVQPRPTSYEPIRHSSGKFRRRGHRRLLCRMHEMPSRMRAVPRVRLCARPHMVPSGHQYWPCRKRRHPATTSNGPGGFCSTALIELSTCSGRPIANVRSTCEALTRSFPVAPSLRSIFGCL